MRDLKRSVANPGVPGKRKRLKKPALTYGYARSSGHFPTSRSDSSEIVNEPMRRLIVTKKAKQNDAHTPAQGLLRVGGLVLPCAIGRSGISHNKLEGDGASPSGIWPLLGGFYRPDRGPRFKTLQKWQALRRDLGWCDDPASASYNRPVLLPASGSHEIMWRDDGLYDLIIVLGHNLYPRRKNRGSAIFLHCASGDLAPTAGCVALRPADFRRLIPRLSATAVLIVK